MAVKKSKVAAAKKLAAKIKAKRTKKTSSERYRKQGQNDPQSKAWTEQSDESVAAKPVGYRWTTYGAEKLGKNVSVRPSIQDIEKYKNKTFRYKGESVRYLYSERRVDKSDKVRKNKFEDGGEMIGKDIQGAGMFADGGMMAKGGVSFGKFGSGRINKNAWIAANYIGDSKVELGELQSYLERNTNEKFDKDKIYTITRTLYETNDYQIDDNKDWKLSKIYRKRKMADGGKVGVSGRQYDPYREDIDAEKEAKPAGWRFTDRLAKRLGKSVYTRPTKAEIEKYAGRGVYYERREDKADSNPSRKYRSLEVGGELSGSDIQGAGMFAKGGEVEKELIDSSAKSIYDKKGMIALRNTFLKAAKADEDAGDKETAKYRREVVAKYQSKQPKFMSEGGTLGAGSFKRGGATFVSGRQYDPYREDIDAEKEAKPAGWRFTDRLAKRLGKSVYARPTIADIEKYAGRGVYYERREDKADSNPSKKYRSLEVGGEMEGGDIQGAGMFARGGKIYSDKEVLKLVDEDAKFSESLSESQMEMIEDAGFEYDYDREGWVEMKSYGHSPYGDDDDYAKGGSLSVSGRQRPTYRKDIDEQKQAKPTGWRFTDRLAKRLGKSAYARPTLADIEKYAGRGVYYERRQDKADANPSKKYRSLEAGGEMEGGDIQGAGMFARGGVARVSNAESRTYTENMLAFKANNLEGKTLENGDYVVLSYGYYPIWYYSKKESKWYGNKDKYSVSTAKHISQSRPTYDATMLGKGELLDKMMDNNARFENGGVLDAILSDAPVSTTTNIGGTQFSSGDLTPQMDLTNPAF